MRSSLRFFAPTIGLLALLSACAFDPEIPFDDGPPVGSGGRTQGSGGGLQIGGMGGEEEPPPPEIPWTCGDGVLEPGELCDDGNEEDDDGCSADCQEQDLEYECEPGEPCVRVVECGNGSLEGEETCDDANTDPDDGCSAECLVEDGFSCPRPGAECVRIPVCGNGLRERGEECDTGTQSADGCTGCVKSPNFWCPVPGQACVPIACGNGFRTPGEGCDDGDLDNGDGCDSSCQVEANWTCLTSGCVAPCGDGVVQLGETCDTGATVGQNGSGCSATCQKLPGFACPSGGGACTASVCQNGIVEPGEGCDDDNSVAGDGCNPSCQNEPTVSRPGPNFDPVVSVSCGDGLVTGTEECDDGNTTAGDGCSDECDEETGYECDGASEYPSSVQLRVTYRDFKRRADTGGHPDFEWQSNPTRKDMPGPVCTSGEAKCTTAPGVVCPADTCGHLDQDGKPTFHLTGDDSQRGRVTSAATYALWYRDTNGANTVGQNGTIDMWNEEDVLTLNRVGGPTSDVYQFTSSAHFPLNGRGFGNTPGQTQNYHFTTELRYFFQYKGGETLTFRGDDDVWVFINGRHAVDIGGVHGAQWGRVILGDDGDGVATDSNCSVHGVGSEPSACALEAEELENLADTRFGLTVGGVYEIVLFHAERHTSQSNFNLTLAGFLAPTSQCVPVCGDGHLSPGEVCDDGDDNADGVYGACNETCTARVFCGDSTVQGPMSSPITGPETCDDGFNVDFYSRDRSTAVGCAPACMAPPYCGDGAVQAAEEDCEASLIPNNDPTYAGCTASCLWAPFCGDNVVQGAHESCDDGPGNVGYADDDQACGYDCQPAPYCGDGERNGPEKCDLGAEGNTGEYGGCNADCTLAPRCGDGERQPGEDCDAGPIGSLSCTPTCRRREVITR